jgi:hypothetical protein
VSNEERSAMIIRQIQSLPDTGARLQAAGALMNAIVLNDPADPTPSFRLMADVIQAIADMHERELDDAERAVEEEAK